MARQLRVKQSTGQCADVMLSRDSTFPTFQAIPERASNAKCVERSADGIISRVSVGNAFDGCE